MKIKKIKKIKAKRFSILEVLLAGYLSNKKLLKDFVFDNKLLI